MEAELAMRVLFTSSRMPYALDEIRKFGREGHEVFATDTFRTSPGSHSRYARRHIVTASPIFETKRFLHQLESILRSNQIDLLIPSFEEVFPIAKHAEQFAGLTSLFCSDFEVHARLHDKAAFVELCRSSGLPVPETRVATSHIALLEAIDYFGEYMARPAYSRGGVDLLTNVPPRAGAVSVEECTPTVARPWVVQPYVRGEDVCSFTVAHHGRIAAHCTYIHPITINHAGGISFESIEDAAVLEMARRVVASTGYHGQISLDFIRTPAGLTLIECNPRPTAGSLMMDSKSLVRAVLDPDLDAPHLVPAGVRMQIASAIVRDMFHDWRAIPSDLRALFSGVADAYTQHDDIVPGIYQLLSYSHVLAFRHWLHRWRRKQSDLVAAQFYDLAWNGGEIP